MNDRILVQQDFDNPILSRKAEITDNIFKAVSGTERLDDLLVKGFEVYTKEQIDQFDEAIKKSIEDGSATQDNIEKAMRDKSKLVQKTVTDSNGHKRTVWVKPGQKAAESEGDMKDKKKEFVSGVHSFLDKTRKKPLTEEDEKEAVETYNAVKNNKESGEYKHGDILDHVRKKHGIMSHEMEKIIDKHKVERHKNK